MRNQITTKMDKIDFGHTSKIFLLKKLLKKFEFTHKKLSIIYLI